MARTSLRCAARTSVRASRAPQGPYEGGESRTPGHGPRRRRAATALVCRWSGAPAAALQSGEGSNWSVRTLSGEDHGALVVEMIDAALSEGGQALVAVPEVRWGSATLERLSARWPQTARVDSAQPDGDRARAWLRIGAGAPLGAGGRSTVLAPADQLRLIVVDDEHHVSYKEDRSPRYDRAQGRARESSPAGRFLRLRQPDTLGRSRSGGTRRRLS